MSTHYSYDSSKTRSFCTSTTCCFPFLDEEPIIRLFFFRCHSNNTRDKDFFSLFSCLPSISCRLSNSWSPIKSFPIKEMLIILIPKDPFILSLNLHNYPSSQPSIGDMSHLCHQVKLGQFHSYSCIFGVMLGYIWHTLNCGAFYSQLL